MSARQAKSEVKVTQSYQLRPHRGGDSTLRGYVFEGETHAREWGMQGGPGNESWRGFDFVPVIVRRRIRTCNLGHRHSSVTTKPDPTRKPLTFPPAVADE
ncbi:MAG TPA: hypothetical protein VGM20_04420 [Gemmatimonadales bacterium]